METIYYCNVGNVGWTTNGKEYKVKDNNNWKYINVGSRKIGVSKLPNRLRIRNFEDFMFNYIFNNWHNNYPCVAMELFINKKLKQKK